jgi:hypothetical protein
MNRVCFPSSASRHTDATLLQTASTAFGYIREIRSRFKGFIACGSLTFEVECGIDGPVHAWSAYQYQWRCAEFGSDIIVQ